MLSAHTQSKDAFLFDMSYFRVINIVENWSEKKEYFRCYLLCKRYKPNGDFVGNFSICTRYIRTRYFYSRKCLRSWRSTYSKQSALSVRQKGIGPHKSIANYTTRIFSDRSRRLLPLFHIKGMYVWCWQWVLIFYTTTNKHWRSVLLSFGRQFATSGGKYRKPAHMWVSARRKLAE